MSKLEGAINKEMARLRKFYPTKEALLLPLLHAAQKVEGFVSDKALVVIVDQLDLPMTKVRQVLSFYTMFRRKPIGKYHFQFCNNIACWLRGSEKLIHHMEKKFSIKMEETTTDGRFTLSEVECLGACGTAPVCQVNDTYYENLNIEAVDELLEKLH